MSWRKRAIHYLTGVLVILALLLALLAGFFTAVGLLTLPNRSTCNRSNETRLTYLEPGHIHPGSGSIYDKGVGPGPPPSIRSDRSVLDSRGEAYVLAASSSCSSR